MHPRSYRLKFPEPAPSESDNSFSGSATPSVLRVRPASPPPRGPDSQAALALEPRELWIAAHVPQLPLLALRAQGESGPRVAGSVVIIDPEDHHQRIIDAGAGCAGGRECASA